MLRGGIRGLMRRTGARTALFPLFGRTDTAAAYSFRNLSPTYAGPVVRARRASDNAELDFYAPPGGPNFPTFAAINAWSAGNAFATTFYDQSGAGRNLLQATAAKQPQIINAANSRPALLFDGVNDNMRTAAFALPQPMSYNLVYRMVTSTADGRYVFDGLTTAEAILRRDGSVPFDNGMFAGASAPLGDNGVSMPVGTRGVVAGVFNGVSSRLEINAATVATFTGNSGTQALTGLTLGSTGGQTVFTNLEAQEWIWFNTAHSQALLQADSSAMRLAWGF